MSLFDKRRTLLAGAALAFGLYWYYLNQNDEEDEEEYIEQVSALERVEFERLNAENMIAEKDKRCVISELWIYPVKSMKGVKVQQGLLEREGFKFDRRWMVIDEKNAFLSQRRNSLMSLVTVRVCENDKTNTVELELSCPSLEEKVIVPIKEDATSLMIDPVRVWDDYIHGVYDQGDDVAIWLEKALQKKEVRLVYLGTATRPIDMKYRVNADDKTSFSDGFPYLLLSQASLNDLNHRIYMNDYRARNSRPVKRPLEMNRFRPNIVVSGLTAYEEDSLSSIKVMCDKNDVAKLDIVKPCSRCKMTTIDQDTGETPKTLKTEPLITLGGYRIIGEDVYLGQNLIWDPTSSNIIRVGDSFEKIKKN